MDWHWCIWVNFSSFLFCCNYYTACDLPWQFATSPGCSQAKEGLTYVKIMAVQTADSPGLEGSLMPILCMQDRQILYSCSQTDCKQNSWQLMLEQDQQPSAPTKMLTQAVYRKYGLSRKIKHCCFLTIQIEKEITINTYLWVCQWKYLQSFCIEIKYIH